MRRFPAPYPSALIARWRSWVRGSFDELEHLRELEYLAYRSAKQAAGAGDWDHHHFMMMVADALHACRLEAKGGYVISQEDLPTIATHVRMALTDSALLELGYRPDAMTGVALAGLWKRLAHRLPPG